MPLGQSAQPPHVFALNPHGHRHSTELFHPYVEYTGANSTVVLDLNPEPIHPAVGKSVGEAHLKSRRMRDGIVHEHHSTGKSAHRVDVSEHVAILPHDEKMPVHSHVWFKR